MTRNETLVLRIVEAISTVAIAAFACTLAPVGTFVVGMGFTLILLELQRWENGAA